VQLDCHAILCVHQKFHATLSIYGYREIQAPKNDKELNEQEVFHDAVTEEYLKSIELAGETSIVSVASFHIGIQLQWNTGFLQAFRVKNHKLTIIFERTY